MFVFSKLIRAEESISGPAWNYPVRGDAGLDPFLHVPVRGFGGVNAHCVLKLAVSYRLQAQLMRISPVFIVFLVILLEAGAVSIRLRGEVRARSAVIANIVRHPVSVFAIRGVIGLILSIPVHEGAGIDEQAVADFSFQGKVGLDEIVVAEISEETLNVVVTDSRRIVIPGTCCVQRLRNDTHIRRPAVVQIDAQGRAGAGLGELVEIFLNKVGVA